MDLTQEQIIQEFTRQVRLCSGIGYDRQAQILADFWDKEPIERLIPPEKKREAQVYRDGLNREHRRKLRRQMKKKQAR